GRSPEFDTTRRQQSIGSQTGVLTRANRSRTGRIFLLAHAWSWESLCLRKKRLSASRVSRWSCRKSQLPTPHGRSPTRCTIPHSPFTSSPTERCSREIHSRRWELFPQERKFWLPIVRFRSLKL